MANERSLTLRDLNAEERARRVLDNAKRYIPGYGTPSPQNRPTGTTGDNEWNEQFATSEAWNKRFPGTRPTQAPPLTPSEQQSAVSKALVAEGRAGVPNRPKMRTWTPEPMPPGTRVAGASSTQQTPHGPVKVSYVTNNVTTPPPQRKVATTPVMGQPAPTLPMPDMPKIPLTQATPKTTTPIGLPPKDLERQQPQPTPTPSPAPAPVAPRDRPGVREIDEEMKRAQDLRGDAIHRTGTLVDQAIKDTSGIKAFLPNWMTGATPAKDSIRYLREARGQQERAQALYDALNEKRKQALGLTKPPTRPTARPY